MEHLAQAIQEKIDNLNKPKGSLGRLEELALQIGLVQQTLSPTLSHPCHLLLGADHGIQHEGVSASPREVTWQQMLNFAQGGGGVNFFCRQHGFSLLLADLGVDYDLSAQPLIRNCKVSPHGTRNFLHEAAMTQAEMSQALKTGRRLADECHAQGCNILSIGEMGIGNTSPSSLWMHLLLEIPLADCIGAGSGLDSDGIHHKSSVLQRCLQRTRPASPEDCMREFGGFEMVAAVGAMLQAMERGMLVMIDGFIMSACALMASRMDERFLRHAIFAHQGDEAGHRRMLETLRVKPLLHLGLRLGEGTGALCAYPLVESAVRMMNEMNDFAHAGITKYF